mgnify:FL=1
MKKLRVEKNVLSLRSKREARMAESVDALVSNTNGVNSRAGSRPAPGTSYLNLFFRINRINL